MRNLSYMHKKIREKISENDALEIYGFLEDSYDRDTIENFISFKNKHCQTLSTNDARLMLDENEFIEEEGLDFEQIKLSDQDSSFFQGKLDDKDFIGLHYDGYTMLFTEGGNKLDLSNLENKSLYQEHLSWLLLDYQSVDTYKHMGNENEIEKIDDNIYKITAEKGVRYIYKDEDEVIGGINIKDNVIDNIHTHVNHRQKGIAKKLINRAKKDFPKLKHSDNKTELGNKMASKIKL